MRFSYGLCSFRRCPHSFPLYITFDGETYYKDRTELSTDEFYRRITEEKIYPRTSLPSVQDYIDAYLPAVKENIPIVTICLSTALKWVQSTLPEWQHSRLWKIIRMQNHSNQFSVHICCRRSF